MQQKIAKKSQKNRSFVSLSFKYGFIFLLSALSIILVACGANSSSGSNIAAGATATPQATKTMINLNSVNQISPTPTLPPQWCGIWITDESPVYSSNGTIPIYAKFVSQQNGNPVGIGNATVNITIQWGDLTTPPMNPVTTTANGLVTAYASMSGHSGAINKLSLVTATFTAGSVTCSVGADRPASFALLAGTSSTTQNTSDSVPTPTAPTQNPGGNKAVPPILQFPGGNGGRKHP
jgi:hypothetical protein